VQPQGFRATGASRMPQAVIDLVLTLAGSELHRVRKVVGQGGGGPDQGRPSKLTTGGSENTSLVPLLGAPVSGSRGRRW